MRTFIKKAIAIALTLCTLTAVTIAPHTEKISLSPVPIVAEAAVQVGNFSYIYYNGNAYINAYTGSNSNLSLPSSVTINNITYKVDGITAHAFAGNTHIRSVTLPYGYTIIGEGAFSSCKNLTSISLPSTLAYIYAYAFQETGLTSITLPSSLKGLQAQVFNYCANLKTVDIKTNQINTIPNGTFNNCSSLTSVSIPSSIRLIDNGAFQYCKSLKSITIPYGVMAIGNYAFSDCTNLSSISLPSSAIYFGENVFYNTPWFNNHSKTNNLVIHNNVLLDGSNATGNISIPSNVIAIANGAFRNNKYVRQISIPSSVMNIGNDAFSDCANLSYVNMQSGIKNLASGTFRNCTSLSSINLPDSVEVIGKSAFLGCTSLTSFRFPNNLKGIDNGAFDNCSSLTGITNVNTSYNYSINIFAFTNTPAFRKINSQYAVTKGADGDVKFYNEAFTRKYFYGTDSIGFIQDFLDIKCKYIVNRVKSTFPNYNPVQLAFALENVVCAMGCSPMKKWEQVYGNTNYPDNMEDADEFHHEASVLFYGIGVCMGYAKTYNLLLKAAGITSEIVSSAHHSWNVVKFDGKWFNIDSYWDDMGSSSSGRLFMVSYDEIYEYEKNNNDDRHNHDQLWVNRKENNYGHLNQSIDCSTVLGDVDLNGTLNDLDYQKTQNYIACNGNVNYTFSRVCADMNLDDKIDENDLKIINNKINRNK